MYLKIFSSKTWLPASTPYHFMLYPFWGKDKNWNNDPSKPGFHRFDKYVVNGKNYFEMVEKPDDADFLVYPMDYGNLIDKIEATSFPKVVELARLLKKKIIVFYFSDFDEPIDLPEVIIFRNSLSKETRFSNEYAIPGFVDNCSNFLMNKQLRAKQLIPSIGYCGYVDFITFSERFLQIPSLILDFVKDTFFHRHMGQAKKLRGAAARQLLKSKKIRFEFIQRSGYWGKWAKDNKIIKNTFKEYMQTIEKTDYHLVVRGNGNFSFRFSEVLSCGRIPVFVNTDCVLPYEDIINWKELLVWVEEKEVKMIDKLLLDFHSNISDEAFIERQQKLIEIFEEYISPNGFFKNMHKILKNYL